MAIAINKLRGTGVAIVTPFDKRGNIDFPALERLIKHLLKGKVEYIVTMGTTGESATLSKEEKAKVVAFTIKTINKRVPIVLGIGGNNTQDVVTSVKSTDLSGVDAILSVSPYYNKPSQEGIYQHYKAVAGATQLPVILYNVPSRTSSNIAPETILRLAKIKNIIAIKEAAANLEGQQMQVLKSRPKDFLVISGDDALTLPILAAGGDGVISVIANAYPKEFSDMVRHGLKGDVAKARKIHYRILDLIGLIFADGNPGGIKAVLKELKITETKVRLPLVPVNRVVLGKIKKAVKGF